MSFLKIDRGTQPPTNLKTDLKIDRGKQRAMQATPTEVTHGETGQGSAYYN